MSLHLVKAELGHTRRERAQITLRLDEEDLEYLTDIMTEERLRDPRDGAPVDYLETLAEAKQRLSDERAIRADLPGLVIRVVRS